MDDVYAAIKDECIRLDLRPVRVDENVGSGFIIQEIKDLIERAEFITFDLSKERPNVYYELGCAHGVGNEAEFIEQSGVDPAPEYYVQYTFHIQRVWKGKPKSETIIVKTGMGLGDCGWEFRPGFSYIIYGYVNKDSVHTNTGTRTLMAGFYPHLLENAKTEIQSLDSLKQ